MPPLNTEGTDDSKKIQGLTTVLVAMKLKVVKIMEPVRYPIAVS